MNDHTWEHHSAAILSLLDGASVSQLEEIIADINDLLTAQVEDITLA